MFKDYYAILEISSLATLSEIRTAYRRQAIKWHPDKNLGVDTTEQMRLIIEAKLLLTDEEARIRYDKEYARYTSIQNQMPIEPEVTIKKQEVNKQYSTEQNNGSGIKNGHFDYQVEDEILKKWMENARKQALKNILEMVTEFKDSSVAGFGEFTKIAFMAITISVIYAVIILILNSI
jgi:curved DNA-binding protein CbpA